ncbi:unnamed protein product [Closterium sp. Yama58-4]|nr:unnamed protein product [Closterium sp. Yama58-4]
MFKKSSKPKNVRKRQLLSEDQDRDSSSSGGGDEDASAGGNGPPKSKSARRAEGKLAFTSASSQQRAARAAAAEAGTDGAAEGPARPAVSFAYESDRRVQMASDSRATATLETETEFDRDSRAIREKVLKQAEEALKGRAREGGSAAAGPAGPPGSKKEESFVDPVVTKCRHYFCEHCALKHHSRNKNCFVCEQPTQGVFNTAHDIIKRVKERAAKEAKDKEEIAKGAGSSRPEAAGGDGGDSE